MFIGIKKVDNTLFFGPCDLNKSHHFRNILSFGFVKLLEYYGLDNVEMVVIEKPEVMAFREFLEDLGFILDGKVMELELTDEKKQKFLNTLETSYPEVLDRVGQIKELILRNMMDPDEKAAEKSALKIIKKVKNRDKMGSEFWNYRSIVKLKSMLNTAVLQQGKDIYRNHLATAKLLRDKLVGEEFFDFFVKTLISSFETYIRKAYLEEFFSAIDGKSEFPIPYVQEMVGKLKDLIPEVIEKANQDEYKEWIDRSMRAWQIREDLQNEQQEKLRAQSELDLNDFAPVIKSNYKPMIKSLVDHYNDNQVYFGVENCFQ